MKHTSAYRFPRAMVVALLLLLLAVAGLWAKDEKANEEPGEEWETPVETPIEIQAATVQQRQDSLFADIDEQFKLVRPIFENACFNCHSAYTDFPWYAKVPGIKQFINGHVEEGREHLDMTDGFPFKGKGEQLKLLEEIRSEVEEGKMPLLSYRLMHWSAWLSDAEKDSIYMWVDTSVTMLQHFYDAEKIPYKKGSDEKE